jgi:hypothetical protein
VWYVASNLDRWLVGMGREALVSFVEESGLPPAEQDEVIAQIDRVVNAYRERKIDQSDLERILVELEDAPAMRVLALVGADEAYLSESGLNEQEQAAGRRTFQRVLRGVYEGKIEEESLYVALEGVGMTEEAGGTEAAAGAADVTLVAGQSVPTAGDDDVRELLAKLKVMADNAQVPDEPFELDISDEIRQVVDKALAK